MFQHNELAAGRWKNLSFCEQMANIGSEIERAIKWLEKNNPEYSQKALQRALELIYLTIDCSYPKTRLRELTRLKEVILDFFLGENVYNTNTDFLRKYFYYFNLNARKIL